jgi:hypothetical protein
LLAACVAAPGDDGSSDATSSETGGVDAEASCAEQQDENACVAVDVGLEDGRRCLWASPSLLATPCDTPQPLEPRCLAAQYHGNGCGSACPNDALVSWRVVDGGLEVFSDPLCEYSTIGGWEDWQMPMVSDDELACICAIE